MTTINGTDIGYFNINCDSYIIYSQGNLIYLKNINIENDPITLGIQTGNRIIYQIYNNNLFIYTDKIYVFGYPQFSLIDVFEYPYALLDFKIEASILYTLGYDFNLEGSRLYYNKVNLTMPSLMQPLIFEINGTINSGKICINYDENVYLIFDLLGNLTFDGITSIHNTIRDGVIIQLNYYDNVVNYICSMNTVVTGINNNDTFLINDCINFDDALVISLYFEGSRNINNLVYSGKGNIIVSYEDHNFINSLYVSGKNALLVYNDEHLHVTGFNENELYLIQDCEEYCIYNNPSLYKYIISFDECLDYVDLNIIENVKMNLLNNIEGNVVTYSLFSNDLGTISYIEL